MKPKIIILGAGLSGLLSVYRLKKSGFPVQVIEARKRLGGRIHTIESGNETPIEMGATWFGPQHRNLIELLDELSLSAFKQYMQGPIFYEADHSSPPQLIDIPQGEPSFRIVGGTRAIIDALSKSLEEQEIVLGCPIKSISFGKNAVLKSENQTFEADVVISTLPPALLFSSIDFSPALPQNLTDLALQTHTWMQDSIKAGISLSKPFWREKNWAGTLFSNVGPLTEFYDHNNAANTKFALCGFVHETFASLSQNERIELVHKQLSSSFGTDALEYLKYEEVVWSEEVFTKHRISTPDVFPHQNNGHQIYQDTWFDDRLYVSGSETSPQYGGYMDGAVFSANSTIKKIITKY